MSLNPAQSSATAEQPVGAAGKVELTDAFLQDLAQNPSKAASLDRETRKQVLKRLGEMGDETGFEQKTPEKEGAAEEKKPEEAKTEQKPAPETPAAAAEQKPEELPIDSKQARKRHQELVDEANRWEQKVKTAQARRDKAKKAFEEIEKAEVKPPEDFLDDKYQTDLKGRLEKSEKRLQILEKLLEDRDREEIEELTKGRETSEEDRIFSEIESLQEKFPDLKTKRPIKRINAEYAEWDAAIVAANGKTPDDKVSYDDLRKEAMERYQNDQAFRESIKVKPPEEMDKLRVILSIHHRKLQNGGSYKANYLEMLDDDNVLETAMQKGRSEAAKEAARETVKAMKKSEDEIQTLSPTDGTSRSSSSEGDYSPANIRNFLEMVQAKLAAGQKLTPEEKQKSKMIREALGKSE